jgi:hypothetical protein
MSYQVRLTEAGKRFEAAHRQWIESQGTSNEPMAFESLEDAQNQLLATAMAPEAGPIRLTPKRGYRRVGFKGCIHFEGEVFIKRGDKFGNHSSEELPINVPSDNGNVEYSCIEIYQCDDYHKRG